LPTITVLSWFRIDWMWGSACMVPTLSEKLTAEA